MPALVSLPSAPTLAFGKNNSWLQNTFTRPIGLSCLTHSILKSILARLLFSYVLVKEVNQIKSFDWRSDSVIKSILTKAFERYISATNLAMSPVYPNDLAGRPLLLYLFLFLCTADFMQA